MLNDFLLPNETLKIALIAAGAVLLAVCFLYGIFRKFTQMSWIAWQIPLVFAIGEGSANLLAGIGDSRVRVAATAAVFFFGTAVVLGLGGIVRLGMHKRTLPAPGVVRFFNRLLGAITAVLDLALLCAILASLALPAAYCLFPDLEALSGVYALPVWEKIYPYLFDFFTLSMMVIVIRAGWRVGFGRAVLTVLMIALTLGGFAAAVYLTFFWSFLSGLAGRLAALFSTLPAIAARALGSGIVILAVSLLFFLVAMLLGKLLHFAVRGARYVRFLAFFDGTILALVFFAVHAALLFALYFAVNYLSAADFSSLAATAEQVYDITPVLEGVRAWTGRIAALFTASPLSKILYECNPILFFVPIGA